jgi:hypothetical protein
MTATLQDLQAVWLQAWPRAIAAWSPYIQLSEPIWCFTPEDEKREGLTGSFAMIRLLDHRVVISLRQIADRHLEAYAVEILAHEIGHHVYCPADLTDNARLMAHLRKGLPSKEYLAPFIGNLYADLLLNDRLQRSAGLSMAAVYQHLSLEDSDRLWRLYMRTYEFLWRLPSQTLALGDIDARINSDAQLCTRLLRNYSNDWVNGAGRFASLYLPYLLEAKEVAKAQQQQAPWNDTQNAGQGGLPAGLTEIDDDEDSGAIHPSLDPDLTGIAPMPSPNATPANGAGNKSEKQYRGPMEYADIIKAAGANVPQELIIARYYKELALPHLIKFPVREVAQSTDPMPEGLDLWDADAPVENIDWLGTLTASPVLIPGCTTRERHYGTAPGSNPETVPLDLYLGVDCSGSMGNPAQSLSYPILAATVIALSALRARANVMVALSGEPGRTITTDGFIRDENTILKTVTSYLGTGTTFGIHRLAEMPVPKRPAHILIITDNDIFSALSPTQPAGLGWDVARNAAIAAKGGATYVLQVPSPSPREERMHSDGWQVSHVSTLPQLLIFAREFSKAKYTAK